MGVVLDEQIFEYLLCTILDQKFKKVQKFHLFIGFFINFDGGYRLFAITKDHVQVVVIGLKYTMNQNWELHSEITWKN